MSDKSLTTMEPFQIAGHRVEPSNLRVSRGGKDVRLEAKAMQVLVYLAEHAGRAVSRDELEGQVWPGRVVTEDSVTNAIAKLRRVFGDNARHPRVIETVPKSGYRLIAEVMPVGESVEDGGVSSIQMASAERQRWIPKVPWIIGTISVLLLLIAAWRVLELDGKPLSRTASLRPTRTSIAPNTLSTTTKAPASASVSPSRTKTRWSPGSLCTK